MKLCAGCAVRFDEGKRYCPKCGRMLASWDVLRPAPWAVVLWGAVFHAAAGMSWVPLWDALRPPGDMGTSRFLYTLVILLLISNVLTAVGGRLPAGRAVVTAGIAAGLVSTLVDTAAYLLLDEPELQEIQVFLIYSVDFAVIGGAGGLACRHWRVALGGALSGFAFGAAYGWIRLDLAEWLLEQLQSRPLADAARGAIAGILFWSLVVAGERIAAGRVKS